MTEFERCILNSKGRGLTEVGKLGRYIALGCNDGLEYHFFRIELKEGKSLKTVLNDIDKLSESGYTAYQATRISTLKASEGEPLKYDPKVHDFKTLFQIY